MDQTGLTKAPPWAGLGEVSCMPNKGLSIARVEEYSMLPVLLLPDQRHRGDGSTLEFQYPVVLGDDLVKNIVRVCMIVQMLRINECTFNFWTP